MGAPRRVPRAYIEAPGRAPDGVRGGQYVAAPGNDGVVVFLIGMRVNRYRHARQPLAQDPILVADVRRHAPHAR